MILETGYWWRNYGTRKEVYRNLPAFTRGVRESYSVGKAMREFRRDAKLYGVYRCFHNCTRTDLHIHHIRPVSVAPQLAGNKSNFLLACSKHHLYICHNGNWKNYAQAPGVVSDFLNKNTVITKSHESKKKTV